MGIFKDLEENNCHLKIVCLLKLLFKCKVVIQLYFEKEKMKIKHFFKVGLKQRHLQINRNQRTSTKATFQRCISQKKKIIPQKVYDKLKQ